MTAVLRPTPPSEVTRRLAVILAAPPPLLIVSDFDGTLAAITTEPMATRILPAARTALRRLAATAAERPERLRVVVLSGRSSLDVAGRVRVGGLAYHGNHGLESGRLSRGGRAEGLLVELDEELRRYIAKARALGDEVARRLGDPAWLLVEDKGPSVSFHFRQAADPSEARIALLEAIEAAEEALGDHGLVALEGRKVVEFRPVGTGGKGAAMERLIELERPGGVLVLGDDRSDADAFEVARAARNDGRIEALTVGVHGATETPPEILAAADIELPDPGAAARLLGRVARMLADEATPG